jgi:hypothetical protein
MLGEKILRSKKEEQEGNTLARRYNSLNNIK